MAWTDLGAQFCYVLGFGVLFALAFVPPAPVGKPFYRLMGGTAALSLAGGVLLQAVAGPFDWFEGSVVMGAIATLGALSCMRQALGPSWWAGLALGLVLSSWATAETLDRCLGLAPDALSTVTALATGAVAGAVGLAMVLGHWYLTVPKLDVRHLVRLNKVCMACMLASLALVAATCFLNRDLIEAAEARPLFGPWGMFFLGTRLVAGLGLPLLFAWMARGSLLLGNTRSATGILYASTVLVLMGTAISISLQDTYGIPL